VSAWQSARPLAEFRAGIAKRFLVATARPKKAPVAGWTPEISSAAVKVKTGRGWNEWLAILDREKAGTLGHKATAKLLNTKYGVPGWWSQMVTVGYEQARGLRAKHQRPDGFEIGVSRMIEADVKRVFSAWLDARSRARWLRRTKVSVHKSSPHKSMRVTWTDGAKSIAVNFYRKGAGKTQVALQHGKLASATAARRMKAFWGQRLAALKGQLEK
jgi:uncharacterized protein YndB with AHSA1/START domain